MRVVFTMISSTAVLPPPILGTRRWQMMALRFWERRLASCSWVPASKKLSIRSRDDTALLAWMVDRHRWPVLAKRMAYSMVTKSRISPMRMTLGASRMAARMPLSMLWVSVPISRLVTRVVLGVLGLSRESAWVLWWPGL